LPLEGIRVVEYGVFHAGPGASAILGDLGAEVVKIENGIGDPERYWARVGRLDMRLPDGESVMFQVSNRNKKGIWLDIESEKGRGVLHRLVGAADVFLTNLRKSTKKKLGIDYASLQEVNPRIVHANVSGYGPEGPMSDLGAFDPLGLARSGMMFVTGSEEPTMMHLGLLDQATAIAASHAILTALLVRERKGIGQEVHASLYGTGQWIMYPNLMVAGLLGVDPIVRGERTEHSPLRNRFRCKDGKWVIGTHHPEEKYWPTLCEATGQTHLLTDPRFSDGDARATHCAELVALFDQVFVTKTRDEWMEIFVERGMMFSSVQRAEEIRDDPQALANGYVADLEDPELGSLKVPGYPIHFSACRAGTRHLAPKQGQHTDEVLREIGYDDPEIGELREQGVVR
jgi:crotonobetainyl-CoA:carnitine CoA-transferase CaiB-like acyl-CoA transferase